MERWVCAYCKTVNPAKDKICLACGAPQIILETVPDRPPVRATPPPPRNELEDVTKVLRKVSDKVDDPVQKGWHAYYILWRTLGEAFAIATACFIIGMLSAVSGLTPWGILVCVILGFMIGRNTAPYYTVSAGIFGAAVFGALAGVPFWLIGLFGLGLKWVFFASCALTLFAALGASYKAPSFRKAGWWDRIRPIFGVLGGLLFAALGSVLAWAVTALVQAAIQWISSLMG